MFNIYVYIYIYAYRAYFYKLAVNDYNATKSILRVVINVEGRLKYKEIRRDMIFAIKHFLLKK